MSVYPKKEEKKSELINDFLCFFLDESPNKVLHFENGYLSADPLEIPGDETIEVDVQILKDISGHHYTFDVTITKLGLLNLKVPCIENVGSW